MTIKFNVLESGVIIAQNPSHFGGPAVIVSPRDAALSYLLAKEGRTINSKDYSQGVPPPSCCLVELTCLEDDLDQEVEEQFEVIGVLESL